MIRYMKIISALIAYFFSGLFIRNSKKVMFGSWYGKSYGDNSKYIYEYMMNNKRFDDYKLIWVGESKIRETVPQKKNTKFIKRYSLASIYHSLTSKTIFITNRYNDIVPANLFCGANVVQLWHGGGIKKIVADALFYKKKHNQLKVSQWHNYLIGKHTYNKYQYFITSSKSRELSILSAFRSFGINNKNIIKHGQPRNDYLIDYKDNYEEKKRIKKILNQEIGVQVNKKIILYLPTFRDNDSHNSFSFTHVSNDKRLNRILEENDAVILEKAHLFDQGHNNNENSNSNNIIKSSNIPLLNTQELLLAADALITDYSGCYLDYLLLDRPIIHYTYDYEYYKKSDRGFKFDISEVAGGPMIYEIDSLINEIRNSLLEPCRYKSMREKMKKYMNSYEKGNSSVEITKKVFNLINI